MSENKTQPKFALCKLDQSGQVNLSSSCFLGVIHIFKEGIKANH